MVIGGVIDITSVTTQKVLVMEKIETGRIGHRLSRAFHELLARFRFRFGGATPFLVLDSGEIRGYVVFADFRLVAVGTQDAGDV